MTLDEEYEEILAKFSQNFEDACFKVDKARSKRTGYIFIFNRDTNSAKPDGMFDLTSNLTTEAIINYLEATLASLKESQ